MKRTRRWLAALLALALCLTLLPATALAAEVDWAKDAVSKLNSIYGTTVFSADDGTMTVGDLNALLTATGWNTDKVSSNESGNLSRGTACEALADVFDLPIGSGENAAINYLYKQNIINGTADGLKPEGNVTKAEFAVLTYRVLNSVGGGKVSASAVLKPGSDGYFEWMYLAARGCVPFQSNQMDTPISSAKLKYVGQNSVADATGEEGVSGSNLWDAWAARLDSLLPESVQTEFKPEYSSYVEENTTLLTAAKTMVAEYVKIEGAAKTIFSDVVQGDYDNGGAYYDGVMYLFDQRIVKGQGDGTFGMEGLPRYQLAALLARLDNQNLTLPKAIEYAVTTKGYMTGNEVTEDWTPFSAQDGDPWLQTATREEAIVAVMKQQNVDISNVNTAILDRFTGGDSTVTSTITNAEEYVAFAVSRGLVNGTGTSLALSTGTNRGEIGVLLYRTLIGLDTSKMHDYGQNVQNALGTGGASTEP